MLKWPLEKLNLPGLKWGGKSTQRSKISRRSHRHPGESCFPEVFALHTAWIQDIRGEPVNGVLAVKKPKLYYE